MSKAYSDEPEQTSYFSHFTDPSQSSSDVMRCVLHKTDQSDRQAMTSQRVSHLGKTEKAKLFYLFFFTIFWSY